jgi:hypothetical protein
VDTVLGIQGRTGHDFNNLARIHNGQAAGQVGYQAQIMGYQHISEGKLFFKAQEQIDDLGLDGHIQGAYRLIGQKQAGAQGQGPGNADTLALSSAELVRVKPGLFRGQTHRLQEKIHFLSQTFSFFVNNERFAQNVPHRHPGIQRGDRVLENYLHSGPQSAQAGSGKGAQILAVEKHLARAGRFQAQSQTA